MVWIVFFCRSIERPALKIIHCILPELFVWLTGIFFDGFIKSIKESFEINRITGHVFPELIAILCITISNQLVTDGVKVRCKIFIRSAPQFHPAIIFILQPECFKAIEKIGHTATALCTYQRFLPHGIAFKKIIWDSYAIG